MSSPAFLAPVALGAATTSSPAFSAAPVNSRSSARRPRAVQPARPVVSNVAPNHAQSHYSQPQSMSLPEPRTPRPNSSWAAMSRAGRDAVSRARARPGLLRDNLRAAVDADPTNPFVWHAAAMHEVRDTRSLPDAHRVLDAAMDAVPAGRRAALYLARGSLLSSDAAVAAYEDGLEDDPDRAPLYVALAYEFGRMGQADQARAAFDRGVSVVPHGLRAQIIKSWAAFEHNCGKEEASRDLWRRATELDPHDPKAWRRLAEAEDRTGARPQVVAETFKRGLTVHPSNGDLRIGLARVQERLLGAGASREYLADPSVANDHAVQRALAMLEVRERNFDRARVLFRHAANLEALDCSGPSPMSSDFLRNNAVRERERQGVYQGRPPVQAAKTLHAWALMEARLGEVDAARDLLHEAQTMVPDDAAIWRALAEIESRSKNFADARNAFKRSIAIDSNDVRLWLAWGKTEALAGNLADAERLLQTAVTKFENGRGSMHSGATPGFTGSAGKARQHQRAKGLGVFGDSGVADGPSRVGRGKTPASSVNPRMLADALRELSSIAVQNGDFKKAIDLLERATETDPMYDLAWRQLSELICRQNGIEDVREMYRRALDSTETLFHAKLVHWWALEERKVGCFEEARDLLRRATCMEPSYMSAWLSWALLEKASGSSDRACELFEEAAGLCTRSSLRAPFIFQAWGRVEEIQRGDVQKAREVFQRGCRLVPDSGSLLQAWAALEERRGLLDEARDLYQRATKSEPRLGFVWQSWGLMEMRRRCYDRAAFLFRHGHENDPSCAALLASWAMMEGRELANVERGRQLFRLATQVDSKHAPAWHSWGSLELSLGNVDRARELYLQAARLNPEDPVSWHALGILEIEVNESLSLPPEYFRRALDADDTHAISYQSWALFVERKDGDLAGARKLFELGVEKCSHTPGHGQAVLFQAWAIMEQKNGDVASARRLFQKGLEIDRRKVELWTAWALLEKACGNRKAARNVFRDGCAATAPVRNIAALYAAWGTMEAEVGNWDEARALFLRGIRINPSHEPCWRSYANLEERMGNRVKAEELRASAHGILEDSVFSIPSERGESADQEALIKLGLVKGVAWAGDGGRAGGDNVASRAGEDNADTDESSTAGSQEC
jgi:tetratricopeptide (TPR) repeat protein